jgi:hypothetical protein
MDVTVAFDAGVCCARFVLEQDAWLRGEGAPSMILPQPDLMEMQVLWECLKPGGVTQ